MLQLARDARPETEQAEIVERARHRAESAVIGTVVRTAQDYAFDRMQHPSLAWLDHLIASTDNFGALVTITASMPEQTLTLRERAADLQSTICDALGRVGTDTLEATSMRSDMLNNLAVRLSALGRREDALTAAEEAVSLRRTLAAQRPDAFRPNLATSLNNLATMLSELGRRGDALTAAEEAVSLRRTLASQRPDAFRPDLATSLMVLANCVDELDRKPEGLAANAEAIETLAAHFAGLPNAFASLMGNICRDYVERCEALGSDPDVALLVPVIAVFQRLNPDKNDEE